MMSEIDFFFKSKHLFFGVARYSEKSTFSSFFAPFLGSFTLIHATLRHMGL